MTISKIISGDTHIVEPPDLYTSRMPGKLRARAPYVKRQKTPEGKESDAWFLDDIQVLTLGTVTQVGQRFEDPEKIDFVGIWEGVHEGAYKPTAMVKALEFDGVWGAIVQPSLGLVWYHRKRVNCSPPSARPITTGWPTSANPFHSDSKALAC